MEGQLRIDSLFAFIIVDDDGTEGVPAFQAEDGSAMPMVGADLARVKALMPIAEKAARQFGKKVTLAHFSVRTEEKTYDPESGRWTKK